MRTGRGSATGPHAQRACAGADAGARSRSESPLGKCSREHEQRYRLRNPASGREIVHRGRARGDLLDRETGEPLEVVGKLLPLAPSQSRLPWAVENLRFCPWCDQLAQKDLNDCPTCGRRMGPLGRSARSALSSARARAASRERNRLRESSSAAVNAAPASGLRPRPEGAPGHAGGVRGAARRRHAAAHAEARACRTRCRRARPKSRRRRTRAPKRPPSDDLDVHDLDPKTTTTGSEARPTPPKRTGESSEAGSEAPSESRSSGGRASSEGASSCRRRSQLGSSDSVQRHQAPPAAPSAPPLQPSRAWRSASRCRSGARSGTGSSTAPPSRSRCGGLRARLVHCLRPARPPGGVVAEARAQARAPRWAR